MVLGKFAIGRMKLSSDRKWLAMEHHPPGKGSEGGTFDVDVGEAVPRSRSTIRSCSQLLDIASFGKAVAVVREKKIELWDVAGKLLKSAPFTHTRIDAARFSPDGKLLALSGGNQLVLWRWEENSHERIDLGRRVGSLTFSPEGRFLAEGPTAGESIQIRDLETRKVVQTLSTGTKVSLSVPRMVYAQGGRVLIACDNSTSRNATAMRPRIYLWDTASGSLAHQVMVPAGLPTAVEVVPNGRYLAALLDDGDAGLKLSVWRLDGAMPVAVPPGAPPAAVPPR
jgi:WD40 repeat protein